MKWRQNQCFCHTHRKLSLYTYQQIQITISYDWYRLIMPETFPVKKATYTKYIPSKFSDTYIWFIFLSLDKMCQLFKSNTVNISTWKAKVILAEKRTISWNCFTEPMHTKYAQTFFESNLWSSFSFFSSFQTQRIFSSFWRPEGGFCNGRGSRYYGTWRLESCART